MKILSALVIMIATLAISASVADAEAGTVNTGSVDIVWSIEEPGWDAESPEEDVSSIECVTDGSTLSVTVHNAYPSIDYLCTFGIQSVGTVPVHLSELVFSGLPNGFEVKVQDENGFATCFAGIRLHESDAVWATLHLRLTDDVPNASATYTFTGEITAFQWTGSPAGFDCPIAPVAFLLIDEDTIDDGIETMSDKLVRRSIAIAEFRDVRLHLT